MDNKQGYELSQSQKSKLEINDKSSLPTTADPDEIYLN